MTNYKSTARGTSRRSIVKGAAWAAPVVAISTIAPAYATSPDEPIDVVLGAGSCKQTAGSKRYQLELHFENKSGYDIEYVVTSLTVTPNSGSTITFTLDGERKFIAEGGTDTDTFVSDRSGDLANGTAAITYIAYDTDGNETPVETTVSITDLPPCKKDQVVPPPDGARSAAIEEDVVEEETSAEETTSEQAPAEEDAPVEAPAQEAPAEEAPAASDGGRG